MKIFIIIIIVLCLVSLHNKAQTLKDADGNEYHTVKIGSQVWLQENLKVTKYRNGDVIPKINDSIEWVNLASGAFCDYNNNGEIADICGKLYNWYTVTDRRGLCPIDYHVPTDAEWSKLTESLGGETIAGGKMKASGTEDWQEPNTGATNEFNFTALPGGNRGYKDSSFENLGKNGYWWSATESISTEAWGCYIDYDNTNTNWVSISKMNGFSVRCIKDNISNSAGSNNKSGNSEINSNISNEKNNSSDKVGYVGSYKDGKKNGHGKMNYENGSIYVGEWKDDMNNGHGKMIYYNGNTYEGEWKDNIKNGHGKMILSDGQTQEGEWKDDKLNGYGTVIFANGKKYNGYFVNHLKHGKGIVYYANGNIQYEGEFKNDKEEGQGTCYDEFPNGNKVTFTGEFKDNDVYNGTAITIFPDGTQSITKFKNGVAKKTRPQ